MVEDLARVEARAHCAPRALLVAANKRLEHARRYGVARYRVRKVERDRRALLLRGRGRGHRHRHRDGPLVVVRLHPASIAFRRARVVYALLDRVRLLGDPRHIVRNRIKSRKRKRLERRRLVGVRRLGARQRPRAAAMVDVRRRRVELDGELERRHAIPLLLHRRGGRQPALALLSPLHLVRGGIHGRRHRVLGLRERRRRWLGHRHRWQARHAEVERAGFKFWRRHIERLAQRGQARVQRAIPRTSTQGWASTAPAALLAGTTTRSC